MVEISIDSDTRPHEKEQDSLGQLIQRITVERGPFTQLTEKDLEASDPKGFTVKSKAEKGITTPTAEDGNLKANEEEEEDDDNKNDLLDKVRDEMIERIGIAINEAALSLDFVSLLISGVRPQAVSSSLSTIVKENVSLGSLSADLCTAPQNADLKKTEKKTPSAGWKVLALDEVSSRLTAAHKRLSEEASQEKRFWSEIVDTVSAGEIIVEARNKDRKLFDIKYGFGESGSNYIEKGIGKVVRSTGGRVKFVPQSVPSRLVVRFTIFNKREDEQLPLAESNVHNPDPSIQSSDSPSETLASIAAARRYLFEDELFLCLIEEARQLSGHKIHIFNNKIVCQIHDEIIEIDQVPAVNEPDQAYRELKVVSDSKAYKQLVNTMCDAAHLLLTYKHKHAFATLHTVPPPLESSGLVGEPAKKQTDCAMAILKPILAWRHHSTAVDRIVRLIEVICPGTIPIIESCNAPVDKNPKCRIVVEDSAIQKLREEPRTEIKFEISGSPHKVEVQTPLGCSTHIYYVSTELRKTKFYDLMEVEQWIRFVGLGKGTN